MNTLCIATEKNTSGITLLPKSSGVYAVVYEGGIVKFGKATNLMSRCSSHQKMLCNVSNIMYIQCAEINETEKQLLKMAKSLLQNHSGREYFLFESESTVKDIMKSMADMLQQAGEQVPIVVNHGVSIDSSYLFVRKITNVNSEKSYMLTPTGKFFLLYLKFLNDSYMSNQISIHNKRAADATCIPERALALEIKHMTYVGVLKTLNTVSQKESTYEFYDPLKHDFLKVAYQL